MKRIPCYLAAPGLNVEKLRNLLCDRRLIAKSELENGDIVDCNWEPVLDEELFNRVQSKLPRNSGMRPANRTKSRVYLLEGLVKCGKCGSTMTYAKAKGRTEYYFYYRCNNKHRSASSLCKARDIPAQGLENFVLDLLKSYAVDSDALAAAIREANEGKDDKLKVLKSDLARLQKQHAKVEAQITTLLDVMERRRHRARLAAA